MIVLNAWLMDVGEKPTPRHNHVVDFWSDTSTKNGQIDSTFDLELMFQHPKKTYTKFVA